MASVWTSAAGIAVIAWALREVFSDLFRPSQSGTLSANVGRGLFGLARRIHWMLPVAGPLSIVVVISCWALLLTIGFALVYWARFPDAFFVSPSESREPMGRFWAVLYFSLATLTTVGSGELAPSGSWVRIVAALESLIGFALVTASITWIVLIYPALGRMRTLARRAAVLEQASESTGVDVLSASAEILLSGLAEGVMRSRVDFIHFPLIYYFHTDTEGASLPEALERLSRLANAGCSRDRPEPTRLCASMLNIALSEMARVLQERFVTWVAPDDPAAVFRAVAEHHLMENKGSSSSTE